MGYKIPREKKLTNKLISNQLILSLFRQVHPLRDSFHEELQGYLRNTPVVVGGGLTLMSLFKN